GRVVGGEEPREPGRKVGRAEGLPPLGANRGTEPAKLTKLVRGELDWIVMKALEKNRNRRYDTANSFAMDIQRYLADEPVLACPPSAWYRFRKFTRRNKAALVMTACVLAVVVGLAGSIGWGAPGRAVCRTRIAGEISQYLERSESFYRETKLPEAALEAQKAQALVKVGGGSPEMGQRVQGWTADLDMAARLEDIALEWYDHMTPERTDADFTKAFRGYGIDVDILPTGQAAALIGASRIKEDLVNALDVWAARLQCPPWPPNPARLQRLQQIAQSADPDPWRQRLRQAIAAKDLQTLRDIAASAR